MRNQSIKVVLPISILLALVTLFGSASQALAQPAVEKIDVLVSFKEKPGKAEHELIENAGGKVKNAYNIIPAVAASVPKAKLDALRRHPKVASVEEDITVKAIEDALPWGVDRVDADVVHSQITGSGVRVAVLDTGIDLDHPDLSVAGHVSFLPETTGDDDNGHGTMVAGVIAALDNGNGIVGVAPEVELYSVKVLSSSGSGPMSVIIAGLEWAIENNMQVINISFGGILNWPQAGRDAIEKAYQSGIVIVAGAGNSGDQGILYAPARYDAVIAVGATDQNNARADFSSTGATLELMAPGVAIQSTSRGGGYANGNGTSFSPPHVSGIAALLISAGITNNGEIRKLLQTTATDLGAPGKDNYYGYGLVNVSAALKGNRNLDFTPPTTQVKLTGVEGGEGWYRSDVTVELTAKEAVETQYSLDNGRTWQKYAAPFTIARDGLTNIQAKSQDSAGNVEIPVRTQAKIDKTNPTVSISTDPTILWPSNHKLVMVNVNVTGVANDAISGLGAYQISMKDEYGTLAPVVITQLKSTIALEAWREGKDLDGRTYTISLTAKDKAGNEAIAETVVIVPHDNGKNK